MKISVITVAFNSASTIGDTLRSVSDQTFPDVEHIVIDGGSTDGTVALVRQLGTRVQQLVSEPDAGIYDAMNKGIRCATGDVIGFLNADDMYAHDQVLYHVAEIFGDASVDACYADLVYVDPIQIDQVVRYWKSREFSAGLFKDGWMPAHPTFYVKRRVYERYGGFDLNYRLQADFELTMRLLEVHKIRALYMPEIWVKMRTGGVSNRSICNVMKGNLEAYRACRKNGLKVSPLFMVSKILSRIPQFFRKPL